MDELFAPWRIEWVERDDKNEEFDGCVFCELPKRDDDRTNLIIARSEHAVAMLNNYPYAPGHMMVIPREHCDDFRGLSEAALVDHGRLKGRALDALDAAFNPDGYNVGLNLGGQAAGGSIDDHLHTHVVPRWNGDTNFMPVVGDTSVIVEALEDSYDRLHEAFASQKGTKADGDEAAVKIVESRQDEQSIA